MKTGLFLMKHARTPQNEAKVPFRVDLPLRLRNFVSGKDTKVSEKGCLHEFTLTMACLEKFNYEDKSCAREIDNYHDCYRLHLKNMAFRKQQAMAGILTPGARVLQRGQLNQLLAKYPQV